VSYGLHWLTSKQKSGQVISHDSIHWVTFSWRRPRRRVVLSLAVPYTGASCTARTVTARLEGGVGDYGFVQRRFIGKNAGYRKETVALICRLFYRCFARRNENAVVDSKVEPLYHLLSAGFQKHYGLARARLRLKEVDVTCFESALHA